MYNIKIGEAQISNNRSLLRAMSNQLSYMFQRSQAPLKQQIRKIVYDALISCPEVQSLRSGTLKYDFGLVSDVTDMMVSDISEAIEIEYKPVRLSFRGFSSVLKIYLSQERINLMMSSAWWAHIPTETAGSLPWLKWLLTAGDSVVIAGYSVAYGNWGRSGGAIMFKYKNFQVDPNYSGTIEDNFITRAINQKQDEIEDALRNFKYG